MNVIRLGIAIVVLALVGCRSKHSPLEPAADSEVARSGAAFDPTRAGRISGRVTWAGPIPNTPPFLYGAPRSDGRGFEFRTAKNPHRPHIEPGTRAIANAVIGLRGVNPENGKPWDLPSAQVELEDAQIVVAQGTFRGNVGFVRRGEPVSFCSKEATYQVIRGRGDAFFGLTLPERDRPVMRTLTAPGRVELSSGNGLYWARANLFVTDHPYFTVTDADGRFTLDGVPSGTVELVVWLPNWAVERQERDADSTVIARQTYGPPLQQVRSITITPGCNSEVLISLP